MWETWVWSWVWEDYLEKGKEKSVLNIHWKDWCWSWNFNILVTWCEDLTHWKRPWCWERLEAGGEGNDRGWDGGVTSPNRWTWFWVSSGSFWRTGKPGVLQSIRSQRVGHDWVTELIYKANICYRALAHSIIELKSPMVCYLQAGDSGNLVV